MARGVEVGQQVAGKEQGMSKIIDRVRERQDAADAAKAKQEAEDAARRQKVALGLLAVVAALAAASGSSGRRKQSKYDLLDHVSGYSLFDKISGG